MSVVIGARGAGIVTRPDWGMVTATQTTAKAGGSPVVTLSNVGVAVALPAIAGVSHQLGALTARAVANLGRVGWSSDLPGNTLRLTIFEGTLPPDVGAFDAWTNTGGQQWPNSVPGNFPSGLGVPVLFDEFIPITPNGTPDPSYGVAEWVWMADGPTASPGQAMTILLTPVSVTTGATLGADMTGYFELRAWGRSGALADQYPGESLTGRSLPRYPSLR